MVADVTVNGYKPLRISDMPKVEVDIVSSIVAPTGTGERSLQARPLTNAPQRASVSMRFCGIFRLWAHPAYFRSDRIILLDLSLTSFAQNAEYRPLRAVNSS
jgi:hypothetical protein